MTRALDRVAFVLIDAEARRRDRLAALAASLGASCLAVARAEEAPSCPALRVAVLIGPATPSGIAALRRRFPAAALIVGEADDSQAPAVAALRAGADDFVSLDRGDGELAERVAHHLAAPGAAPDDLPDDEAARTGLVGASPVIAELRRFARRVAQSDATALVTGETGAGKECVALLLHRASRRAGGPLVAVNCAAIPEALLESELFGHARGAFSGAVRDHAGKMALADGGTLFLDEVGELSLAAQAKLLRAVETREVHSVGARAPRAVDIRLVAATNRDLAAETAAGRFREDLYYRLAVARIRMPPLRERAEDIPALARHLLRTVLFPRGGAPRLSEAAAARLCAHPGPATRGSCATRWRSPASTATATRSRPAICPCPRSGRRTIRPALRRPPLREGPRPVRRRGRSPAPARAARRRRAPPSLDALRRAGDNKAAAARALNCSRMTLYRRMARHGLDQTAQSDPAEIPTKVVNATCARSSHESRASIT
jgi:DNA-binding NtrC family response regulator